MDEEKTTEAPSVEAPEVSPEAAPEAPAEEAPVEAPVEEAPAPVGDGTEIPV